MTLECLYMTETEMLTKELLYDVFFTGGGLVSEDELLRRNMEALKLSKEIKRQAAINIKNILGIGNIHK